MIGGPAARFKMGREEKTMFETKRENIFESDCWTERWKIFWFDSITFAKCTSAK